MALDAPVTKSAYAERLSVWNALREEVVLILSDAFADAAIKIHAIESRVKEYDSLQRKLERTAAGASKDINDVVGARVVCLFKSDLERIEDIIRTNFSVRQMDNKVEASEDSFGYMSVHYICEMDASHKGPRYNKIKNLKFEIQVRTLCMHAWAAISHYLEYKAEWDIPTHLKKGLNALSGLFYVADEQYERLYDARQASKETAEASREASSETPINLDTVTAFLKSKFVDRKLDSSTTVSSLVRELLSCDYKTIEEVDADIDRQTSRLNELDEKHRKDNKARRKLYFTAVGAVRIALQLLERVEAKNKPQ